jgi:hypothetical protein
MRAARRLAVAGLCALACGANRSTSVPEMGATARMPEDGVTGHVLAADAVRVVSRGLVEAPGQRDPRLQLSFILVNDSLREWSFDTRQQHLALVGHSESAPLFASTSPATPYIVKIPPRSARVVELFFALPPEARRDGSVPPLDVVWIVDSGGDVVAGRTVLAH